jgi:hypothetical protein
MERSSGVDVAAVLWKDQAPVINVHILSQSVDLAKSTANSVEKGQALSTIDHGGCRARAGSILVHALNIMPGLKAGDNIRTFGDDRLGQYRTVY